MGPIRSLGRELDGIAKLLGIAGIRVVGFRVVGVWEIGFIVVCLAGIVGLLKVVRVQVLVAGASCIWIGGKGSPEGLLGQKL